MNHSSQISELVDQGQAFTYQNFALKSSNGYPNAYTEEWLVWTHGVTQLIDHLEDSTITAAIKRGLSQRLIGYGQDDFSKAHRSMLEGLRAARRVYQVEVPASDRIVSLGHNSPERTKALEQIDELIDLLRETNDFPGDPEEKEQIVAEISAGKKLLESSRIRAVALATILKPPLKWLAEKAGAALVGKAAAALWDYLTNLDLF